MKKLLELSRKWLVFAVLWVCAAAANAAPTEFVIIRSTSNNISVGEVVSGPVTVASGENILALRQDGARFEITGPHSGPIGAPASERSAALERIIRIVEQERARFELGAVRGGEDETAAAFDIVAGGSWCGTRPPLLALPPRPFDRLVRITLDGRTIGEFRWAASAPTAPWPLANPLAINGEYGIVVDDAPVSSFTVKPLPQAGSDPLENAARLHAIDCRAQAHAALLG